NTAGQGEDARHGFHLSPIGRWDSGWISCERGCRDGVDFTLPEAFSIGFASLPAPIDGVCSGIIQCFFHRPRGSSARQAGSDSSAARLSIAKVPAVFSKGMRAVFRGKKMASAAPAYAA